MLMRFLWRASATLYYPVEQPKMNTRILSSLIYINLVSHVRACTAVYLSHHRLGPAARNDAAHESTLIIRRAAANIRAAIHRLRIDATPVGQLELKA